MLLQLSHFFLLFIPLHPVDPLPPSFPHHSLCPWVIHVSSLSSPFPILFLTSPCLFCTYHLCFFFNLFLFFIVIQLQLSAFSPHPSTPPQPIPPPSPTSTFPLDFVHVSFMVAPVNPSPHYPLPTPLWLLLHCS